MYAKTNPSAGRLTPRQKRIFAITAVLVVVLIGGLAAWGGRRMTRTGLRDTAA